MDERTGYSLIVYQVVSIIIYLIAHIRKWQETEAKFTTTLQNQNTFTEDEKEKQFNSNSRNSSNNSNNNKNKNQMQIVSERERQQHKGMFRCTVLWHISCRSRSPCEMPMPCSNSTRVPLSTLHIHIIHTWRTYTNILRYMY